MGFDANGNADENVGMKGYFLQFILVPRIPNAIYQ